MALPPDDIFIPQPAPEDNSNTPILKVLSRPNTHRFPLHLLTSSRSLDVASEEVVEYEEASQDASLDGDVTSGFDDVSSRNDDANPDDVNDESGRAGEEGEKMEEEPEQSPSNVQSTALDSVILQNPLDTTSTTMMNTMGSSGFSGRSGLRAPLLPLPPLSTPVSSSIFPTMPSTHFLEMLLRQQLIQHLQQSLLPQLNMPQLVPMVPLTQLLQPLRLPQQGVLHDVRAEDGIDVGGGGGGVDRDSRDYTPVLPPTPVHDRLPDAVVRQKDDAIESADGQVRDDQQMTMRWPTDRTQCQSLGPSRANRPAAVAGVAAAAVAAGAATPPVAKGERKKRLSLTQRQRDVFNGIMARVSYIWPAERVAIADAFGITPSQVLNVFINRGGRAYQRQALGMSSEEANRIIREELHKCGYSVKGDDEKKKLMQMKQD